MKKVRDVVGLYLNPPDKALVLSVDEKSQIQALDRTAPLWPLRLGVPARQSHDYKRHGTTTLLATPRLLVERNSTGGFNTGWKGRSARSHTQTGSPPSRPSVRSNHLVD